MTVDDRVLPGGERTVLRLKELYRLAGFLPYKMSKFEEYDLYGRNKDFLVSENVITFTDTNGKLMALKPDVTLSIIKNSTDPAQGVRRVYYDENVYRPSAGTRTFSELRQVGLECFGDVDELCVTETVLLAAESLQAISPDSLLMISHLGLLEEAMDASGLRQEAREALFDAICEKNGRRIEEICQNENMSIQAYNNILQLSLLRGTPREVLKGDQLPQSGSAAESFRRVLKTLAESPLADKIRVDFSAGGDTRYYNGILFKGFVRGVPSAVLSGGQYDRLMKTMRRSSRAIGFAVYCDRLECLLSEERLPDADVLLLADSPVDGAAVLARARELRAQGKSVSVQTSVPDGVFGVFERFGEGAK